MKNKDLNEHGSAGKTPIDPTLADPSPAGSHGCGCKCAIVGPSHIEALLIRYFGIGKPLTPTDTEILLFALEIESEERGGIAAQAKAALDKRGGKR